MRTSKHTLREMVLGMMLVLGGALGLTPLALAQGVDQEPNNTCEAAQNVGNVALPFTVNGSLDTPPDIPDVDFFRFSATPETLVRADLEGEATDAGTLPDPLLGLFDSNCIQIAGDDDGGVGANSRLTFTVPADGIFVLAAAAFPDFDFTGAGGSSGTYRLTLAAAAVIGSISGRIVDAITGDPLPGDAPFFTAVELHRCEEFGCTFVNFQPADSEGRFRFFSTEAGQPLEVGTYQVLAFAEAYQQGQTDQFEVGEGEDRDVGDIPLQPFPVQFSEIRPCGNLPPEGGICSYSVRINNRTPAKLDGATWSIVNAGGIGSLIDFTVFQTAIARRVTLSPFASRVVQFDFAVPDTVRDDAFICADAFFGENRLEPFFNTLGARHLFCISKGSTGFVTVAENQAQKLRQRFDVRSLIPPK